MAFDLSALLLVLLEGVALLAIARTLASEPFRPASLALRAGPFFVLGAVAARAWLHWDQVPARIALHYRFDGQADRWVDKSEGAVFGLWGIGLGLCAFLFVVGALTARASLGPREAQAPELAQRIRASGAAVVWGAQYLVAVIFSLILLAMTRGTPFPAAVAGAATGIFVVWLFAALYRQLRALRALGAALQPPSDAWRAGVFYSDPNDPALFVPKRYGIGYTLNFAKPAAWLLMLLLLGLPIGLLFLLRPR